jgi:hypothetical protein
MGRRPNGSLNGITKPTTRIATNLKLERLLAPQAKDPLKPRYAGSVAKEFEVPPDLVAALKHLMSDAN